jgi:Tol biopolymer transport system component
LTPAGLLALATGLLPWLLVGCDGSLWSRRSSAPAGFSGTADNRRDASLSGDGRLLASVVERRGRGRVLLQEQPGGRVLPLRHLGGQLPHRSPSLSWNGRYLAVIVQQGSQRAVLIEDRLTGRPLRLPLPGDVIPEQLSLAPDGQRLALELLRQGRSQVQVFDLSGLLERDTPPGLRLESSSGAPP